VGGSPTFKSLIFVKNFPTHYDKSIFSKKGMEAHEQEPLEEESGPPIFKSWNQMYAFVLILHAIIILLFYLFTHAYA
jgi:hypothetical protein